MNSERKEFGKWWLWVGLLLVLTIAVGFGLKVFGVFGERVVFEQSYQYKEARKTEIATFEAQLAEINRQLAGNISADLRRNLEAQKAAIQIQLRVARSK